MHGPRGYHDCPIFRILADPMIDSAYHTSLMTDRASPLGLLSGMLHRLRVLVLTAI